MAMLATELHTGDIPDTFRRFVAEIGAKHWRARVRRIKQQTKGSRLLREYFAGENSIAFQLDHFSDLVDGRGAVPLSVVNDPTSWPAAGFMRQVLSLIDASSTEVAERLRGRVRGALTDPANMRGFQLELGVATHFLLLGRRILWPEVTGLGRFDLLVEGDSPEPMEVECKSIGEDKGRKVSRLGAVQFFELLRPHLTAVSRGLATGLTIVVTVPDRFPVGHRERAQLAREVGWAVLAGSSCVLSDGVDVRLAEFDVSDLEQVPLGGREFRVAVDRATGAPNRSTAMIGTVAGGVLALVMQSRRDDNFLDATFDTLSEAARTQLTGSRAGMLIAGFEGLTPRQLLSVAEDDNRSDQSPSALRLAASQFLSSAARSHVVGVGFVSRSEARPAQSGIVPTGGTAYYFPKPNSSFWSERFRGMFNWAPLQEETAAPSELILQPDWMPDSPPA